ncbi:hypothetical protein BE08_05030 [Sorangium cellulosum]|uniref:Phytanoyl-CoA dioxygenase n=1 Tax=Sorangium cellulosum TaxID=56 RepID=A0A150PJH9_SORCE|nr:hypothetical protein BE08_05030 [Sorangium cellulosum]
MNVLSQDSDLIEIPIADPALCAAACREIYAQRPRWRTRRLFSQPPFYTLGAASYLDLGFAAGSIDDYLGDAGSLWLWAGDAVLAIVERVRAALADRLGEAVEYPAVLPSPGFHLFIGAAIPRNDCSRRPEDCASSHFDMQYRHIPWTRWYTSIDLERTISFTLPLKLPAAGGGLTVWRSLTLERLRADLESRVFPDLSAAAGATPSATIPYTVGALVVHRGHMLHQAAGIARAKVKDERITLQGHGVFADGAWRLYW